jgi:hypothetical protein
MKTPECPWLRLLLSKDLRRNGISLPLCASRHGAESCSHQPEAPLFLGFLLKELKCPEMVEMRRRLLLQQNVRSAKIMESHHPILAGEALIGYVQDSADMIFLEDVRFDQIHVVEVSRRQFNSSQ